MCFLLHTHLFVISFIHLLSVEMSNGCICCTLREDLLVEVKKIASSGDFDYLLIESTGVLDVVKQQSSTNLALCKPVICIVYLL